jgi:hypothetical protein
VGFRFSDTVRERCFAASKVHCGDGVSLLVRQKKERRKQTKEINLFLRRFVLR